MRWVAAVEADHVVGGGKHDPLDALAPRGLEQVVAADDVGLQHRLPIGLDRLSTEMDDAIDAGAHRFAGGKIGEIGIHDLFARTRRVERRLVRQADDRVEATNVRPQPAPDAARGAGDQDTLHGCALLVGHTSIE